MLKAIFFDLDYTLYDQQQYLQGAFRDVAESLARECHLDGKYLYRSLIAIWKQQGTDYGYLFNDWLNLFGLSTQARIKCCIDVFHAHQPQNLTLYPGVDKVLSDLKDCYLIGLITDGDLQMQENKARALKLSEQFEVILNAKQLLLRKPDPRIIEYALQETKMSPTQAAYVGDHPVKDIVCARHAGVCAVRVLSGEFRALPDNEISPPNHRIDDMRSLQRLLCEIDTCNANV